MITSRKRLLFVSLGALIALTVVFASFFIAQQVMAQSGGEGGNSSPELPRPLDPALLEWTSSAEPGSIAAPYVPPTPELLPAAENDAKALLSWRVAGTTLRPRSSGASYVPTSGGGCFYLSAGDSFVVFNTTLDLPQGATINTLRMYYTDTSESDSTAWLTVYDLYGTIVQEWGVSSTGNLGNGFSDSALINHVVDYSLYSYVINWRPYVIGNTMQLCGFRVFYEPPPFGLAFMPMVQK